MAWAWARACRCLEFACPTLHALASLLPSVACLHGEMRKEQRKAVLDGFRDGDTRVLVVSDVAARGLDLPGDAGWGCWG